MKLGESILRAKQQAQEDNWNPANGMHKARIVDADVREQRATGTPIVELELELLDDGPDRGQRWGHVMWFATDDQTVRSAEALSVYGLSDDRLREVVDNDDLLRVLDELVGVEVEVSTKARDNGDGVWTNPKMSRGHGSDIPADQTELELGDERKGPPPPKSAVLHDDDDDIPF